MIACVIHGAKELKIENRPEPALPQDGEVLVRFGAGGICGSDLHYYHEGGILDFKIREPLILGHEVAGEVVEIGPGVTKSERSRPSSSKSAAKLLSLRDPPDPRQTCNSDRQAA